MRHAGVLAAVCAIAVLPLFLVPSVGADASDFRFYTRWSWSGLLQPVVFPQNGSTLKLAQVLVVLAWANFTLDGVAYPAGYWEFSPGAGQVHNLASGGWSVFFYVAVEQAETYVPIQELPVIVLEIARNVLLQNLFVEGVGGVFGVLSGYYVKRRRAKSRKVMG
jgi:hypothetical protein